MSLNSREETNRAHKDQKASILKDKLTSSESAHTRDMLDQSTYTHGAHDPIGEDARRSREKAKDFQESQK